ncbi:hypothetical protein ACRAVF_26045 [Bradyrhizobium oligotrophicum S58]
MNLDIISLHDRPDLIPRVFSPELDAIWPEFMRQDRTAMLYYDQPVFDHYADCAYAALSGREVVGRAFAVPFAFGTEGRGTLPDAGWDEVIRWAHEDRILGRRPTTMSALEIALLPKARVPGSSLAMLDALGAPEQRASTSCMRRCGPTRSISRRGVRCAPISISGAPTASLRISGCELTSTSAAPSSRLRRAR